MTRFWRWVAVAALGVGVILALTGDGLGARYDSARAAAEQDDWIAAFTGFRTVMESDPSFRDVARRADEAALHVVAMEGIPVEVEVNLLRHLATSGAAPLLVEVLERAMVEIPAGWGDLGSAAGPRKERPLRSVYLDAFEIDRYEITNAQFDVYMDATGADPPVHWLERQPPPDRDDYPVLGVSWAQAAEYCAWAGKRLPTEAEWERACRGPDDSEYPWGDDWGDGRANMSVHSAQSTAEAWSILVEGLPGVAPQPVGSFLEDASSYGVFDMAGNAAEWTADWYDSSGYGSVAAENPIGEGPAWSHVVRGGAWLVFERAADLLADFGRCAFRNASHTIGDARIGFRCVRDL